MVPAEDYKSSKAETEIAVLKVKVEAMEEKICELKDEVKAFHTALTLHTENSAKLMKELKESSAAADKALADKINGLEKWRWMLMGAGIVIGSLGYETLTKLLK